MRRGKVTGTAARKSIAPYVNSKAPGGQSFPGLFCEMALEEEKEYRLIRLVNRMAAEGHKLSLIHIYKPSVVVDTHVKRISRKLGLTKEEDPEKIEYDLMRVLPEDHWILYNIQIITHGRGLCTARSPRCGECFLRELSPGKSGDKGGKV